jgi:branched-chain amino acid transport system ATP-binding protein
LASSLTISGIHAAYGAVRVIDDVSIKVNAGETVVLLGTNGNGKSTLMKCIMGIVRPKQGSIVAEIDGVHHDLTGRTTEEIVDLGIALVPEGRRLFPKLTVGRTCCSAPSAAPPVPRSSATTKSAARPFRALPSAARNWPAVCPAASSRCWRSAAP